MKKKQKTVILSVGKGKGKPAPILVVGMKIEPTFLKCNLAISAEEKLFKMCNILRSNNAASRNVSQANSPKCNTKSMYNYMSELFIIVKSWKFT